METITKYKQTKNNKGYFYVTYSLKNGFEIPTKRGIIKELPEGIKLSYNNTL